MVLRKELCWPLLATLTVGLLSVGPIEILAQNSTVVCGSSFNWMDNSRNQNPCLVAAYLEGACTNFQYTVNPLPPNSHYTGPNTAEQNECQCSTVTYSLISACGVCQSQGFISWATWAENCTTIYLTVFLPDIPNGTAVPAWAYQNVTISDGFNATAARSVGDNPESTASSIKSTSSVSQTSTALVSVTSSPSTSSTSSTPSTSSTSSPLSSGKSSNTGAIAGGVVGGVVGIALIAGAVIFLKRKPQVPPSEPAHAPPIYTDTAPFYSPVAQAKLYDPSDPSTFPSPVLPTTTRNGSSSNVHIPSVNYSSPSVHPGGHYSGAPEL